MRNNFRARNNFLGKNNFGKTYISYLLYGVFKEAFKWKNRIISDWIRTNITHSTNDDVISINKQELSQHLISEIVLKINSHIHERLPEIFNMNRNEFKDTIIQLNDSDLQFFIDLSLQQEIANTYKLNASKYSITLSAQNEKNTWIFKPFTEVYHLNDEQHDNTDKTDSLNNSLIHLLTLIFSDTIFKSPNVLYIPAERNGINVFREDLLAKRGSDTFEFDDQEKEMKSTYPLPIADYMRYLSKISNSTDEEVDDERLKVWEKFSLSVLKGKYIYNEKRDEYFYREVYSYGEKFQYKTK